MHLKSTTALRKNICRAVVVSFGYARQTDKFEILIKLKAETSLDTGAIQEWAKFYRWQFDPASIFP